MKKQQCTHTLPFPSPYQNIAWKVFSAGGTSSITNTPTTITPMEIDYNIGNGFSRSMARFSAPVSGVYHMDVVLNWLPAAINDTVVLTWLINGVIVQPQDIQVGTKLVYQTLTATRDFKLDAFDQVSLQINTSNVALNATLGSVLFSGFKVFTCECQY